MSLRPSALPKDFHYVQRDARRSVEPPIVTVNPTAGTAQIASASLLSPTAEASGDGFAGPPAVARPFVRSDAKPPLTYATPSRQRLQKAASQPESDGFFPITNHS